MPFDRPTLQQLKDRAAAEVAQRLGFGTLLARGPLRVLSYVLAGLAHGLYGLGAWIARQVIPMTAETEELDRHADFWNVPRKAAAGAEGLITVGGSVGATVPLGSVLVRADGVQFATTVSLTLTAPSQTVACRAVSGGVETNSDIGTTLTFSPPLLNITSSAAVADDGGGSGLSGGVDQETDESLRARLAKEARNPTGSGSAADYEKWALQVPGVTRAWVASQWNGPNTVKVAFVVDDDPVSIIPAGPKVAEVLAYVDARRNVTAALTVVAPTPLDLDPEIELSPDTAAVRAAVEESLNDLLRRESTLGGTVLLSHIREAISIAAGEADHVLVSPVADVACASNEILVLGTITWS